MKKLFLLITIFYFGNNYSQSYIPMLDEANVWSVDFFAWTGGDIRTDQIELGETAVHNGNTYYLVGTYERSAYVREENGIVYINNLFFTDDDEVLYDFNLELGDFITFNSGPYLYGDSITGTADIEFQVTNVETQFIAGMDRKVIELKDDPVFPYSIEYWIEGIGSIKGFDQHSEFADSGYTGLACFSRNGETYFFNGATACDNTVLSVDGFSSEKIILSPNPVVNTSILKLPSEAGVDHIKIYDINGRILKEETVSEEFYTIDQSEYVSGMYFYQLASEGKILKTQKFIVK